MTVFVDRALQRHLAETKAMPYVCPAGDADIRVTVRFVGNDVVVDRVRCAVHGDLEFDDAAAEWRLSSKQDQSVPMTP